MRSVLGRWERRALPPLPSLDRRIWWCLGAIVAAGAVARVVWATQMQQPEMLRDPVFYLVLGDNLAAGGGYSYPGAEGGVTAYYPPGYPLFLGATLWLIRLLPGTASAFDVAVAANVVLSIATIPLVFALGRRLAGERVGLIAAAVTAAWPNLVFHSGVALTETLFLFLLVSTLLVALATPDVARHPGRWRLLTVGALFGMTGLVRPVSLVIGPLFLLLWWSDGVRRAVRNTAVVAVATVAVIVPWSVRNLVQMDAPVLLSTNFGDNLCMGNSPDANGAFAFTDGGYCFAGIDEPDGREGRPAYEIERQSTTLERGVTWARENPGAVLGLLDDRLRVTLQHDADGLFAAADYGAHPVVGATTHDRLADAADLFYYGLAALAAVGTVRVVRRGAWQDRRWQLFVLAAPVQLISPLVTFGDPRFKMPIYPVLAVAAAAGLVGLAQLARRGRPASTPASAVASTGATDGAGTSGSARAEPAPDPATAER